MNDSQRVSILSEALPYIQSFSGRKIVIKYGGSVMEDDDLKNAFFRDIALLSTVGVCPVVIHGGGPGACGHHATLAYATHGSGSAADVAALCDSVSWRYSDAGQSHC